MHDNASDCVGPVQGHHVITQQSLRKRGLDDRLWDVRNGVGVCERAHARHTKAVQRIPYDRLPQAAIDFAVEAGLDWQLERYYPREDHGAEA